MSHTTQDGHGHAHGASCGPVAIRRGDHTDYLHEGHLHHRHERHVNEYSIEAGAANPTACTPSRSCGAHDASHAHGARCAHQAVPHAGNVDYLVGGTFTIPMPITATTTDA